MGLTKRQVDAAVHNGSGQHILYDGDIPGFGLRVYPSGEKAFVLRYRTQAGQLRMLTLGKYGVLTLPQAKELARHALLKAKSGADPAEARLEARRAKTVRELADVYVERYAKPHKKSWAEDRRRLDKHILPEIGQRKIGSVTRGDVAALHSRIGANHPYEANRLLALLSVMFAQAKNWGFLPLDARNPAEGISKFKEYSRDRWVRPGELPKLAEAINEQKNVYIRAAFWLYLMTGVRRSELLQARWVDVDEERQELRLRDTKAGRSHTVPLSESALDILRALPRESGNPYILPGHVRGRPLVNVGKPWRRIREKAGLNDVRLHDLRRTVGSWMATSGASLPLIGSILNHSNASTTQVYARLGEDVRRDALERHGKRIRAAAEQGS